MKKISYTFYALLGLLVCANLSLAQVNLNDGLVVYLPLDNNRLDFSGNNNHGAASGGTGFTADRFGNANSAASFGGTSNGGRITITHNASLVFTTGATFSCWARVNSAIGTFGNGNVGSGGSQCIFAKAGDAGGGFWQLARFENGGLTNQIGNNSVSALTGAIQPYTLGTWFHYVVTMDDTGHKIYVNGVLQSENTIPANLTAMNNRNIGIGRFISNWYPLNGAVDEFRVHNRVLNMDEITALANDDLISISAIYAGPSAVCAGADVTVNYTSTGDFAANNTFTLQLSNASGSFANPIFTTQLVSSNNSGSFTVTIPEVAASGTGYRFRILSSAPNSVSDTTSTFSVTGFVNTIPDPNLYEYVGSVDGNHYYLSTNVTTWHQAQIQALANGGHLAIVPNAQTNTLLANSMATGDAYIGLTDEVTEGTFLWVDGSQLTYSNWNAGEPNNVGGVEHYVALNSNGTWNDTPGGNGRSFMQLSLAGMNQSICIGDNIQFNAAYAWTVPNGATIMSGQGTHQIQVNFNGNFGEVTVMETNAEGCVGLEVKISVNCNVGITEFEALKYNLYPNPTNDIFILELLGATQAATLELYDLKGELISRHDFNNRVKVNIEHLAKGVYMGRVKSSDKTFIFKVVRN